MAWNARLEAAAQAMQSKSSGLGVTKSVKLILDQTAAKYQVRPKDLLSKNRWPHLVEARREAAKRVRVELQYSLPRTARIFGMHHTSILHYIKPRYQARNPTQRLLPSEGADYGMDESGIWAI